VKAGATWLAGLAIWTLVGCDSTEESAVKTVTESESESESKSVIESVTESEAEAVPEAEPEADWTPPEVRQSASEPDVSLGPPIEDPTGSMKRFYDALARTENDDPGAVTRILHMGDSSIGLDGLPHALRKRMVGRFGDGGPGFLLFDRHQQNYRSRVARIEGDGWHVCYIAYLCKPDGHYGLGGHVFRGKPGAWSKIVSPSKGHIGYPVSRVELWFANQPHGGRFRARIDRGDWTTFQTVGELEDRWHTFEVKPGQHRLEVRGAGGGAVRAYGAVLENDGPGIVWDTASMIGAFTKRLHGYDDEHIAGQIEHRDPDLVMLNYGGNDMRRIAAGKLDPADYKDEYRIVLRKLLGPKAEGRRSCLVVSVIDHGMSGHVTVRPASVDAMVGAQREVAFEEGCAFFDSVNAMGGAGSIRTWLRHRPGLAEPDLKHLNHRGRDMMGEMMFRALIAGYEAHRARSAGS
jgi:lysophospholipase L1-like esterase